MWITRYNQNVGNTFMYLTVHCKELVNNTIYKKHENHKRYPQKHSYLQYFPCWISALYTIFHEIQYKYIAIQVICCVCVI